MSMNKNQKIIYLEQKHFLNGTVILDRNYYIATNPLTQETEKILTNLTNDTILIYKLKENISFNPNSSNDPLIPFIDQGIPKIEQFTTNGGYYHNMAYGIGFFAAIVITGNNYIFDLNNYTLEQSFQHYVRQRFFSLIELANSPFLPKVGPHNFIDTIRCAEYVTIRNGTLGRSSHHGIHGNNNNNILFDNLTIRDFEVAAIALNGGTYNTLQNINVPNNNHNVPVLGIWSASLFLYPYIKNLANNNPDFELNILNQNYNATQLYENYLDEIENTLKELNSTGYTTNNLFNNTKHIIDGPNYGILLNQKNVAVNGFPLYSNIETSHHNKLINISIKNIRGFNNEIPTLINNINNNDIENAYLNRNIQNDVVGSVLQTQNYYISKTGEKVPLTINEQGIYTGNIVSNIQLIIAKAIHKGITFGNLSTSVNSINSETITWVENQIQLKYTKLYYIFQGDTMHHVIKGVIALRLDCLSYSCLKNITIENISNETDRKRILYDDLIGINEEDISSEFINIYNDYKNGIKPSHKGATYATNQSSYVRGISFANSHSNKLENVKINNLISNVGEVIDIDYHNDIRTIKIFNNIKCIPSEIRIYI